MTSFPDDIFYSREHTWVRIEGNLATIGITDYAQEKLGEIYDVELPEPDAQVTQDEPCGIIESSKNVAEIISPVSGSVISVNEDINDDISAINSDPYGAGWLIIVEMDNLDEVNNLLDHMEYVDFVGEDIEIG
jgi:glycine cleavage system H protein